MSRNRLAGTQSSYLRTAAHQPTHWHAWGAEAFETARREDKPILLDIGAVWCHWCHVMDRESYEDGAVAELINRLFVPVKVDRDERPDVDARYQKAVQAMIGQGGWPLTVFLLPDGRPFYGGTYFPPRDAHGRPSFRRVLEAVSDAYRNRRDEVTQSAGTLQSHLASGESRKNGAPSSGGLTEARLDVATGHMQEAHDPEWGGFGRAPKFPHPAAQDFLAARARRGDKTAADILDATLDRMRLGGVYDQVAGGYHRYSVDREWHVPHFEKMLYDNAGLLRNHSRAPRHAATAREIKEWLRDVLQQPDGGFGGSQDADVGLEDDGDFFTWSLAEVRDALGYDETALRLATLHYGLEEHPHHMHHDPTRHVLRIQADAAAIAVAQHRAVADVERDLARVRDRLREARSKRVAPFVDPTRYASWNGMAIQALLEYGGAHGDPEADRMALRALDLFLARAYDARRGFARSVGSDIFGMLDDNAQMLDALLEAHLATGDERYLGHAREVADLLLTRFAHPAGAFADRARDVAPDAEALPLDAPERPLQDAPTASANGVALRALLRLTEATGEARYREVAVAALESLAEEAARMGVFAGALLCAMDEAIRPPPRVEAPAETIAWARPIVRRLARPGAVLVPPTRRAPGVLVCLGDRCLAPATDAAELEARLSHEA